MGWSRIPRPPDGSVAEAEVGEVPAFCLPKRKLKFGMKPDMKPPPLKVLTVAPPPLLVPETIAPLLPCCALCSIVTSATVGMRVNGDRFLLK